MTPAVHIDRASSVSLQDQLFEQLRQLILTGGLKPNSRVIATRFLADQAGVSRTTVLLAYERLISEGYLQTQPAVGTFVSDSPPAPAKTAARAKTASARGPRPSPHAAAAAATTGVRRIVDNGASVCPIDFSAKRFDHTHLLSGKAWLQGFRAVLDRHTNELGKAQPPAGAPMLRQAVADHLAATRGIRADQDNVIIVAGRRQACTLIAHVLLRRGDRVITETPGDPDIDAIFKIRGAELRHIPVDDLGLRADRLPEGPARLAYVTPTRQNPLGGCMPRERREQLLAWARDSDAYIVEDDSDAEIRYHTTTPRPLCVEDDRCRVFYTGSFAKALGVGLGLGYLVAPSDMVEGILAIKSAGEEGGAWLEQMIVADLLASGAYDRHLRRVRKIYLDRRDVLIASLRARFGEPRLVGAEVGSQLTWVLPAESPSATQVCEAARRLGVNVEPVFGETSFSDGVSAFQDRALILGYAALSAENIDRGVERLGDSLKF